MSYGIKEELWGFRVGKKMKLQRRFGKKRKSEKEVPKNYKKDCGGEERQSSYENRERRKERIKEHLRGMKDQGVCVCK